MSDATLSSKRLRLQSSQGDNDADDNSPTFEIERLPFEVLSEIFAWTEAVFRDEQGPRVLTPWTPAYTLCRVSKLWRTIALDTPELWTCMTIKGRRSKSRAETWVNHARGHPVTLWGWIKGRGFVDDFLTSHASQIEDLCLTFPAYEYGEPMTKASLSWPAAMSQLLALELQNVPLSSIQLTSVFNTAPHLERLIAQRGHLLPIQHAFDIPTPAGSRPPTHLTHLQVDTGFRDVRELYDLLRLCPDLKFLSVDPRHAFDANGYDGYDKRFAVDLPSLRAVSVPMCPFTKSLLQNLNTPAMERIVVHCDLSTFNTSCKELEDGLRDGSLLAKEQFFFDGDHYDDGIVVDDVIFYLRRMPKLQAFRVSGCQDNLDRLIHFLTTPFDDGTFPLPRLRCLALEDNDHWSGSLKGFERRYEGIESMKCIIPPALESVDIIDCPVPSGFKAARRLFKKHGTKFRLDNDGIDMTYDRDDDLMTLVEGDWAENAGL